MFWQLDTHSWSINNDKLRLRDNLVYSFPTWQACSRIITNDGEQLCAWILVCKALQSVGGEAWTTAIDLVASSDQPFNVAHCGFHQRKPIRGRRNIAHARLLPRIM
jgi:hypothetical protein